MENGVFTSLYIWYKLYLLFENTYSKINEKIDSIKEEEILDILIKNCTLISMSSKREKLEKNMDILIKNGKIENIDKNIEEKVDKEIDATGKVVMPGLINTHAHVPMSIFRETLDGYNLQDWLEKKIWPMEDKLTTKDIYYASLLSFIEMIKTGTTTINDMYFMRRKYNKSSIRYRSKTTNYKNTYGFIWGWRS